MKVKTTLTSAIALILLATAATLAEVHETEKGSVAAQTAPAKGLSFAGREDRLLITQDGQLLAEYVFRDARIPREFAIAAGEAMQLAQRATLLLWSTTLRRADGPLVFGPQHEMGLGFRMATPLMVKGGSGKIRSSSGGENEAGNWGRASAWWDYSGATNGRHAGILAVAAVDNARPVWAHARDYGFLALNPTGVAACELLDTNGRRILVDPFLDDCPGNPVKSDQLDKVDLVVVSHAAIDHLGDTEKIAKKHGCPVICGGEVRAYLVAKGVPHEQIRITTWGIKVRVADVDVQPVECHHWSQIKLPDGTFASGVPMAFVIDLGGGHRFYHYGDTALFSDMKLQAELYQPTIGALGIANPLEILRSVQRQQRADGKELRDVLADGPMSRDEGRDSRAGKVPAFAEGERPDQTGLRQ